MPRGVQSSLIQHHEFLSDDSQLVAHALFGAGEVRAAHAVERGRIATHVLTNEVDLITEHEQIPVGIAKLEEVALDAVEFAARHSLEHTDAVHIVHDVIASLQVFEHGGGTTTCGTATSSNTATAIPNPST